MNIPMWLTIAFGVLFIAVYLVEMSASRQSQIANRKFSAGQAGIEPEDDSGSVCLERSPGGTTSCVEQPPVVATVIEHRLAGRSPLIGEP